MCPIEKIKAGDYDDSYSLTPEEMEDGGDELAEDAMSEDKEDESTAAE